MSYYKKVNVTLIPGDGATHKLYEDVEVVSLTNDRIEFKFQRTTVESNLKYVVTEVVEHSKSVTI